MQKKGISLIVLSITILVMAILAATAIIALEDSGIIGRAKNTTKNTNYADEYTRLIVIKNGILTDNLGTITVNEYVTELQNKGIITAFVDNGNGSMTVTTTSGFDVIISQNGQSDLGIILDGYTPPSSNGGTGNEPGEENIPSAPVLLKFSINVYGMEFTFEDGMTWGEWYESEYCDKTRFRVEDGYVLIPETGRVDCPFWACVEYWDMDCLFGPEDTVYFSNVDAKILPVKYIY